MVNIFTRSAIELSPDNWPGEQDSNLQPRLPKDVITTCILLGGSWEDRTPLDFLVREAPAQSDLTTLVVPLGIAPRSPRYQQGV